jgi:hypothetical protein
VPDSRSSHGDRLAGTVLALFFIGTALQVELTIDTPICRTLCAFEGFRAVIK